MSDEQGKKEHDRKKSHLAVVLELPVDRSVSERHLENLRASGLTDEVIAAANLYTESRHEALGKLVERRVWPRQCGAALVFPFYLPGEDKPYAYRVRPTYPRVIKGKFKRDGSPKVAKYDQASEAGTLVYYPPHTRAAGDLRNTERPLYWTEGEKKALLLDQLGLATVGLTGVWMYRDPDRKDEGDRWHPRISDHVTFAGRAHVIVFDADARTNDEVMQAAGRLAGLLINAGATSVRFVTPLSPEHKGIDDYFAAHGEAVTRQLLATAEPIEPISPTEPLQRLKTIKALRDAPIEGELRLPSSYTVERDGTLWKLGDDQHGDQKIARSPILIQRYLDDYYSQEGRVELCFERDGRWVTTCVARKAIVDGRSMVSDLAAFGAPCTSNNAAKLVDWFDDLERANVGKIPRLACVARGGWHDIDGRRVFVLDEPLAADKEEGVSLALDTRGDRRKLFGALKARGDAAAHLAALKRAWDADPVCAAMICGALAAPLLEPLGAPNFGEHLSGDSSRGKTSILKIAGSVYGDPNSDAWVSSWNVTSVAAELRAAVFTDLPQLYDEVGASDPEATERLVYMLINGGGRARGSRELTLRETPSWHTIVLSTGERGLVDEQAATGAQIRIIQLPVARFGELGAESIDELREACAANAGSFGRQWIEALLGIEDWAPFRAMLKDFVKMLRATATDPLRARLAGYFAVLCVAESLAAQLGIGDASGATMQRLFVAPSRREHVQALADRALDALLGWVLSDADSFPVLEPNSIGELEERRRVGGRPIHGFRRDDQIWIIPNAFREWCRRQNFAPRPTLREWKERGWLVCDPGRDQKQCPVGKHYERLHVLTRPLTEGTA